MFSLDFLHWFLASNLKNNSKINFTLSASSLIVKRIRFWCLHVPGWLKACPEPCWMNPGSGRWRRRWVNCRRRQCWARWPGQVVMCRGSSIGWTEETSAGAINVVVRILTVILSLIARRGAWRRSSWGRWRRIERRHFRWVTSGWAGAVKATTRRWRRRKNFFVICGRDGRWKWVIKLLLEQQLMLQMLFLLFQQQTAGHLLPKIRKIVVVVVGGCFGSWRCFRSRRWRKCRLGTRGWYC